MSAACDQFEATITGKGAHGASPHMGIDPTFALAQVINAIHAIRARRINPLKPCVISIGAIHCGDAHNIIPNSVFMNGTIRSHEEEIRKQLHEELDRAFGVARALGCQVDLKIDRGASATYNDPQFTAFVKRTAQTLLGDDCLYPSVSGMGGEDFSYMTHEKPGTMVNLGAKLDEETRPHHNPRFDIDENALPFGSALYAQVAVDTLKNTI